MLVQVVSFGLLKWTFYNKRNILQPISSTFYNIPNDSPTIRKMSHYWTVSKMLNGERKTRKKSLKNNSGP